MPIVEFEGQQYDFPEDASQEEIVETLNTAPTGVSAADYGALLNKPSADTPLLPKDGRTAKDIKENAQREGRERELSYALSTPQAVVREWDSIKRDEGVRKDKEGSHVAYKDSLGFATGGVGHLLSKEEKKQYPKGTVIPDNVARSWFREDMATADSDLNFILENMKVRVPDDVYDILLNMSFNLGRSKLLGFDKMWVAIELGDWETASAEMLDSKWAKQVKGRAVRLSDRMAAIPSNKQEATEVADSNLTPSKGGLFEDENGTLFMVDAEGNKKEV